MKRAVKNQKAPAFFSAIWTKSTDKGCHLRQDDGKVVVKIYFYEAKGECNFMEKQTLTMDQMVDGWLSSLVGQIKESSYVKYECLARVHILPAVRGLRPEDITDEWSQQFIHSLLAGTSGRGKPLAPKTVRDIMSVFNLIFSWGIRRAERGGWHVPAKPHMVKVKTHVPRVQILTQKEQNTLETYLLKRQTPRDEGILLALYTGIRVGELCALQWKHISLTEGTLSVEQTLQRIPIVNATPGHARSKIIITPPKSEDSIRMIPLPNRMIQMLHRCEPESPEAYFLTGQEARYLEPRSMNLYLKRTAAKLNLPAVHFHILRHTFASRCIEKNFDIKALSEILGHASVNITLNRYVHITLEEKRRNMRLLDA